MIRNLFFIYKHCPKLYNLL